MWYGRVWQLRKLAWVNAWKVAHRPFTKFHKNKWLSAGLNGLDGVNYNTDTSEKLLNLIAMCVPADDSTTTITWSSTFNACTVPGVKEKARFNWPEDPGGTGKRYERHLKDYFPEAELKILLASNSCNVKITASTGEVVTFFDPVTCKFVKYTYLQARDMPVP
ncbi:hypothetical protein TSOC_011934 [Tetrabaena socialis]|uniref:Uncharacterized protein n=1 Tax=Tetrabaena socialis TaxID=47790 RepID=A0A2J7ZPC3_9CHLO|nr:hypothetical protein TSOC_011934 [Tetrabaena socialis]|eukprot:PNH02119.1 hypothetical protein TSOC_011934 [Tetrabaena socialis]